MTNERERIMNFAVFVGWVLSERFGLAIGAE
jgi:hypothetical protein